MQVCLFVWAMCLLCCCNNGEDKDKKTAYYNMFVIVGGVLLEIPIVTIAVSLTKFETSASITVLVFVFLGFTVVLLVSLVEVVMMVEEAKVEGVSPWTRLADEVPGAVVLIGGFFQIGVWGGYLVWRKQGIETGLTFSYAARPIVVITLILFDCCCRNSCCR